MNGNWFDFSRRGWARVWVLTVLGTLLCIAVAYAVDGFSFQTGQWRWGTSPINNLIIPLLLAPPLLFYLLSRQRELAIAHHELLTVAATDSLTQCLNRRAFTAMVEGYLEHVESRQAAVAGALLVIDIDHFKTVNDRFGHDVGDEALKAVAATIRRNVREIDIVGRLGGEEFSVFMPGVTLELTQSICERIRLAISQTQFEPRGEICHLTVSLGGAAFTYPASFSDLYRAADERLYAAKRSGRNRSNVLEFGVSDSAGAALH